MGSLTYDFLSDSFLFRGDLIDGRFSSTTDEELIAELQRYRGFCLNNEQNLLAEVRATPSTLRLFSGIDRVSIDQLKQSALYTHQYVIDDPLLPLTETRSEFASTMGKALGMGARSIDRDELSNKLRYLKKITPMVAGGFVKLLPVSVAFEPPSETPLFYSENYFEDALPPQLMKFFKNRAVVRTLQKVEGGWCIADELRRCGVIHVGFDGYPEEKGHPYWYLPAEVAEIDEEKRSVIWKLSLTESPPHPAIFDAWVRQSINQSAAKVYKQTFVEAMMTADLEAVYSTRSQLVADLLQAVVAPRQTIPTDTVNALMSLELPFLRDVDIETLMRVRQSEGEAFQNFRVELEKLLRELRTITDPEQTERKAQNAVHELTEVQIRDINQKVASLREKAVISTGIAVTGLLAAVQTGGLSLIATAAAVFKGAESVLEYRKEVKRNPAFFLWKVLKKAD